MLSYSPEQRWLTIMTASDVSDQTMKQFLAINPLLKSIEMGGYGRVTTSRTIESIAELAPQIECISLFNYNEDSSGLIESAKNLKRLTALELLNEECIGESFVPLLKELAATCVPLKELQ